MHHLPFISATLSAVTAVVQTQSKGSHRGVASLQRGFEAHSEHQCVFHGRGVDGRGLAARPEGHHCPRDSEYGISSFVYRARKPFHPQRLQQWPSSYFVLESDKKHCASLDELHQLGLKEGGHSVR
jgi:G3E family GTPase